LLKKKQKNWQKKLVKIRIEIRDITTIFINSCYMEEENNLLNNDTNSYMKNEYIDKLTLELLLNKNHYNKYLSNTDPKRYEEFKEYKSKLRKYSVDIIDITSQMIENPKKGLSSDIEETFDAYVKSIIRYYEMKEIEKNDNNTTNEYQKEDEDVMFGNCEEEPVSEEEPIMKSFWGKEKVVKKQSNMIQYDMNMFQRTKSKR